MCVRWCGRISRWSSAKVIVRTQAATAMAGVIFQAEDGIRDHCVTGVQTCALPIFGRRSLLALWLMRGDADLDRRNSVRLAVVVGVAGLPHHANEDRKSVV